MLGLIEKVVDFFFDVLEGLAEFFRRLIPLILQLGFALSPFLLSVLVAYLYGGFRIGLVTLGTVTLLIIVGFSYAYRNQIGGTGPSGIVIIVVIVLNVFLLVAIGLGTSWFGLKRADPGSQTTSSAPSQSDDPRRAKEQLLLELLRKSTADHNSGESQRAISGLVTIQSRASIPLIMEALRTYYPLIVAYGDASYAASVACMNGLQHLGATESCVLLAEIAVKEPLLTAAADSTSQALCK